MSIKVQKYLANLGKSVAYSTADVLMEKFTYANDFKNENQEVFKEAYHSIKDYRTTFARIKKTITDNKVMDAARVGFDSIMYSVSTGDFYAKSKEVEVMNKYGGSLMSGMDIDDDDFDMGNEDVTDGDKVIATAVKKNSKLQTAITTEAIVKTGKAQMDVSKENTMLLYTQNERLLNKLDGGLANITGFLKQNAEQTAKVQNQMNDNLNKFMANVDNNVAKLTKQMDELLEMQRNLYNKQTNQDQNKKKKPGYDDIISRNGVINLREYANNVKKNAMNTLMDQIPGLSMILGDSMGEGSNLLAQMAANPTRELSKIMINKMLGKGFDQASKSLNKTLETVIPNLIAKANAAAKKEDNGIMGLLGKILGIKTGSKESVNTGNYNKGPTPFDGITRKAIIDVIPYYLRKMTSALTGGEEMTFDYNTGRWTGMRAVKKAYDDIMTSAQRQTANFLKGQIQAGTGRSFDTMFSGLEGSESANNALQSLALKLQAAGDFGSLRESDLSSAERTLYKTLKTIYQRSEHYRYERDSTGKMTGKMRKNFAGPDIAQVNQQLLAFSNAQNASIKQLNETGGIAMLAAMEGISGDAKSYRGRSYVDANGDMKERHIQEMPTAQILLKAKDEYGVTLYQYLRSMGSSLNYIKAYSTYLQTLPFINSNLPANPPSGGGGPTPQIPTIDVEELKRKDEIYTRMKDEDRYGLNYYARLETEEKKKRKESYDRARQKAIENAQKKGKTLAHVDDILDYHSDTGIGMSRMVSDYYGPGGEYETDYKLTQQKEDAKKEKERWKKIEEIAGKETTDKLKRATDNYDKDKGLMENLAKASGTTEKLAIAAKWFTQKTNFAVMDKVTGTIVKTDAWLRNLIYGEDLKADDQKKSLWQLMKEHTQTFFNSVKDQLEKLIDPIKKYYDEKIKPHVDKLKDKIFGDVDTEGNILQEGLLSHFTAGFRKGMVRNTDAVHKMWAKEIEEAKKLGGDIKDKIEPPSPAPTPRPNRREFKSQDSPKYKKMLSDLNRRMNAYYETREEYNKQRLKVEKLKGFVQDAIDAVRSYESTNSTTNNQAYTDALAKQSRLETALNERRVKLNEIIEKMDIQAEACNNIMKKIERDYGVSMELLPTSSTQTSRSNRELRVMAAGGINRTGRPFQSVLSAGEYLNGSKIGQTGIYTIPKGGVVYNPAPSSIRNIQARNEKNFIKGLRYNAEANDGLTPEELAQHQQLDAEARKRIEQVDIEKLTDWQSLEDNKQRAAFLGNMASRGVLGGITGLLAGGPILGAAIGAASTLSKSTGSFASLLFGDVEKDKDGNILVDDQGNPKRRDTGLISKELQKAAPDMTKGGMVGLAAGLLTPLGPLGGLLAGTALGFAKNSEIFQGSLFGEGGILSNENVDKLKKGARNMGIGAATAALFLPGPFGLVGSALIGATAGYVTSTDKFKDFLLGEEKDGKRQGGLRGALNDNVLKPLQGFGRSIVERTMDEIFGEKDSNGKRQGGLFGAIRANVVEPMVSGAKSILKEVTNGIADIKDLGISIFNKVKNSMAGNALFHGIFETASKVGSGAIGLAGKVGRAATLPFRIFGDEGIGGKLKAKRIRTGRADDMTARERLAARGTLGMAKDDQWSKIDESLANASEEDLQKLMSMLSYDETAGDINKFNNKAYTVLGQELREHLDYRDAKKIIKMLKEGRDKDVERFLNTRKIDDSSKSAVMKALKSHRGKLDKVAKDYENIRESGETVQQYLVSKGIDIDISDKRKMKNLKLMADRELAHKGVGLTEEEIAFEEEKQFWKGKDSPLQIVNTAASNMERMLENIHYDLTIGAGYDKLSSEEQAKYGSKEAYIQAVKDSKVEHVLKENAANDGYVIGQASKIGSINRESIKTGDFITNDLWNDYVPMFTGDLKGYLAADNRFSNVISKEIDELIDTACQMFDGLALKELCVPERIEDDVKLKINKIMSTEKCDEETAKSKIKVLKRKITITRGQSVYEFEMAYKLDGSTLTPYKKQPASYDVSKRQFVEDYLADHRPQSIDEASYMSFGDIVSKSLKLGMYMSPLKLPFELPAWTGIHSLFVKDAIKTHGKSIISGAVKGLKKIGFEAKLALGAHELDDNSAIQKLNNYQYEQEAEREWNKELNIYQSALESIRTANSQSEEFQNELKEKLADKFAFLDALTKQCDLGVERFGECSKEEQIKVHDKFISLYVQAKKDNQIFGRGLLGGIKQIGKRIVNGKLGQSIKVLSGVHKIIFKDNADGTKEDRMKKLRDNLKRKAERYWTKLFIPNPNDEKNPDAGPELQKLVKELYGGKNGHDANVTWKDLSEKEQEAIHAVFVERFVDGRYQMLMNNISDNIKLGIADRISAGISKLNMAIRTAGARVTDKAKGIKEAAAKKAETIKRQKMIQAAVKNNDERLDEIAVEVYNKPYAELTDDEKSNVERRWYAKYGYHKAGGFASTLIRGATKKLIGADRYKAVTGTLKSGVQNAIQGKLDRFRKFKEEQQEKDSLLGKFFDRLDARQLKKDKENFEGKKDSKIGKIIKWLFVGGIAVPLIVGFITDDVLPAIHEKIQPWLKKAKDKIFGVKDERTGEYNGGIISGIVNPIKTFFKSKFGKVHDWFSNEGDFSSENTGLKGFWKGLKGIGEHIINLWKSGFVTVYGEWAPKILEKVGKNLIPAVGHMLKGVVDYLKDLTNGKQGALELDLGVTEGDTSINIPSTTTEIPTSMGDTIQATDPGYSGQIAGTTSSNSKISVSSGPAQDFVGPVAPNDVNTSGTTYTNNTTGKSVTTKLGGDYYSIGTNAHGNELFKDNRTNKVYVKLDNGQFLPVSEFEEVTNEDLADNQAFQYQKELENNNALEADYSAQSPESKWANMFARIGLRNANNIVINGERGIKALSVSSKALKAPLELLEKIPVIGSKARLVTAPGKGIINLGEKATRGLARAEGAVLDVVGTKLDDVTAGAISKIGQKVVDKEAAQAAKIAEKNMLAAAKADADLKKAAAKKAFQADKLAKKVAEVEEKGGFIGKAISAIKKCANTIKEKIAAILKNPKVAKVIGKEASGNADEIAEGVSKTVVNSIDDSAEQIAKEGSTVAAKGAAKVLSVVMMVADFLLGMDNCRNLLGIVSPQPTIIERITGGLINIIPDVIMTVAEAVTGASFGGAAVVGGILAALSIIATIVISIDSIRDMIVGGIIEVLDLIPGLDMSDIKNKRSQAKAAVEAYNAKNNTNLSIEEYNNLIGNKTVATKIGEGVKNGWSAMFGYDSATKSTLLSKTENLESKGESDKVRKKLATIFSSIWQHYGEEDFNRSQQYDENGNELQGKEKLNANKAKFNEVTTTIISGLNSLLIKESNETIKNVLSNCSEFVGPWDASHHLKDVYKFGFDNPTSQFNMNEEHALWPRIKAMAGVCAIVNEIFVPCNKKLEVASIVANAMMPAYFSKVETDKVGNIAWTDTSQYNLDTSAYDGTKSSDYETTYEGIDKYGNPIATNANADDKLSPLTTKLDPLMRGMKKGFAWLSENNPLERVGVYFGSLINDSIKKLTGGFEGVEEFFKNLASKNKAANKAIDTLSLLPTDKNYWKIELDGKNPFMSGLYNFVESINRVVKAPFALAASSLSASLNSIQNSEVSSVSVGSSNSGSTGSTTSTSSTGGTTTTTSNGSSSSGGIWQGLKNTASKIWGGIKSFFGKGIDDDDINGIGGYGNDPYHIYQRAYQGSFRTAGDSERQTIADSGCGPASAASVLRMYGKRGDMHNAVNYALSNKYKEVNGGTYPEYFNSYLNKNGIKTNSNANNADVVNNLVHGKPVILMGRDSANSGKTPYGSKYSHYVVARGIDKNGNVIVEDSEDKRGSTRYSLADTLKNSSVKITTGRGVDDSLAGRYISGVSGVTTASIGGMLANAARNLGLTFGSNKTDTSSSSGTNIRGDAKAAIGKSYTVTVDGVSKTLKMDEGGAELFSYLVDSCGCTTAAACGAIGNWVQECGGGTIENIKPVALRGQIAEGGGLMQWTPASKHVKWAKDNGFTDYWGWEAQLAHVKAELTEGSAWSTYRINEAASQMQSMGFTPCYTVDEFRQLTNPEDAAVNFERGLEGSSDFWGSVAASESYKNIKYSHLYDFNRRLYALAIYGLVTGKTNEDSSGRGAIPITPDFDMTKTGINSPEKDLDPALYYAVHGYEKDSPEAMEAANNPAPVTNPSVPSSLEELQKNTLINEMNTKLSAIDNENKSKEDQESIDNANKIIESNTDSKGLLSLLSQYSRKLSKGIFGNFYDALYGSEATSDTTSTASNSAVYKGDDVVYAAAMVFEALSKVHPDGTYNAGFFDITCRDGTKIDHVRCDCSGLMTAVIQYMGYYTYKSGREYSDSYHGEGLSSSMDLSQIYDKEGNPTTDWEVLTKENCTGSNAKAGDIRFESGHTDMFVCYKDGSTWPKGFNAGATDGILASYKAAEAFFSNGNKFPMDGSVGASTIRDLTCTKAFRFKGKSASGRGRSSSDKVDFAKLNRRIKSKNYILDEQGNRMYLSDLLMKKYGKGKWGRADEEEHPAEDFVTLDESTLPNYENSPASVPVPENTTTPNTDTEDKTPIKSTNEKDPSVKSVISQLSKYSKSGIKGVYGNFYDALFGSETEAAEETVATGTAGTLQNAIPYSTYGIWKQGWASKDGEPHWCNKGWNTKTAISIGGQRIGPAGCSLCSTALMLVHSGVVQEADFNPGKFADDINSRSECRGGCGTDAPMRHMCEYKGKNTMQFVDTYSWSFGGESFDELYDFCLQSMQEGYFLIGHVTNHFCCIDYIDTEHKVIFIMDPGFRANCWYDGNNKPSCLDSTDIGYTMSGGPSGKKILGVIRYKSSVSNPSCYILNGRRSFDSLHENGDAPNATIVSSNLITNNNTAEMTAANTSEDGNGKYGRGKVSSFREGPESSVGIVGDYDGTHAHLARTSNNGRGVLKSYDDISRNHTNSGRGNVYKSNTAMSNTGRGVVMDAIGNTYAQYGDPNSLANIIRLAAIIADNSNKIDDVITVLATIAANTENTVNSINTTSGGTKIPNGAKNGLSALRTALNDSNSGQDIINAIYQIAKS